jgi:hypothetical protein
VNGIALLGITLPVLVPALYLAAGWRIAVQRRPAFWAEAREEWHSEKAVRESVRARFLCMIFLWALILPVRRLARRVDAVAGDGDPQARERRARELARRISELEAENSRLRREAGQ